MSLFMSVLDDASKSTARGRHPEFDDAFITAWLWEGYTYIVMFSETSPQGPVAFIVYVVVLYGLMFTKSSEAVPS